MENGSTDGKHATEGLPLVHHRGHKSAQLGDRIDPDLRRLVEQIARRGQISEGNVEAPSSHHGSRGVGSLRGADEEDVCGVTTETVTTRMGPFRQILCGDTE